MEVTRSRNSHHHHQTRQLTMKTQRQGNHSLALNYAPNQTLKGVGELKAHLAEFNSFNNKNIPMRNTGN